MRLLSTLLFALLISPNVFALVTIECHNPGYAGKKLEFYSYSDPVSSETNKVFTLEFDKTGKCTKTIESQTTDFVFCDFGIYRGLLFTEPNQTIRLQLPPPREKSFADQKNPYFEPVSFWFATENKQQLNNQVSDFTNRLNHLTDKYFDQLYFRQSKQIYDSVLYFIEKDFGGIKSEAFQFHKKLSLKMVEVDAFRLKPEDYSALFSGVKQQFWLHPSFTSLFDKTFTGQLSFEVKSVKGNEIRKAVNQGNISFLIDHIKTKYKITGEMAELVLLKMLHDAFYSGDFSNSSIQQMIKLTRFTGHQNKIIRETSINISEKITHLQPGSAAPVICLNNVEGKKICTNQIAGKYKYIIFADAEMAVCREHLKYLSAIEQKYAKNLEIFVVLRNTDAAQIKKFFAENEVPGIKLVDENSEFINQYKVKSFPQSYLLDQNHKVKFAATKAPLDGFEQQFGALLQNERLENLRKQGK
jgi:peroxiredoxin